MDCRLYFDFLSPFSFFALKELEALKIPSEKLSFKPVVLAKLLNHWGLVGPAEVDPKREYLFRSCLRYAHKKDWKFSAPKTHPFNPLYALRAASQFASGRDQYKVILTLFTFGWEENGDLGDPDALVHALNAKGLDGKKIYEKSFSKEAKLEIKNNTKEAISAGCFGVPSFVAGEEVFWGRDSIEDLELFLQGKDTLNRKLYEEIKAKTPKAGSQNLNL